MGGFSQSLRVFRSSGSLTRLSRLIGRHDMHARTLGSWTSHKIFMAWLVWLDKRRRSRFSARRGDMNGGRFLSRFFLGLFSLYSTLSPNRSARHARLGHGFHYGVHGLVGMAGQAARFFGSAG